MYTDDAGQVVIYWLTLLASCFYTFSVQFGVIIIPLYYSGELYPGMKDEHLFKYLWVSVCLSVRNVMLFYSKDGSSTSSKQGEGEGRLWRHECLVINMTRVGNMILKVR